MRVLLTGAAGFIGGVLLERLLAESDLVRVLIGPETLARSPRLQEMEWRRGLKVIPGDLMEAGVFHEALRDIEVVFHLAWESKAVRSAEQNSEELLSINLKMIQNMLNACSEQKVRRLVWTSSTAVYGPPSFLMDCWPLDEETPFFQGPYTGGFSRGYIRPMILAERTIRHYSLRQGLEYVILRPSVVYGIGSLLSRWLLQEAARSYDRPPSWWSRHLWPMVHVRDVAEALMLAGYATKASCREFNISADEVATFADMVWMLRAAAFCTARGLPLPQKLLGRRRGNPPYDTTKAETFLGFTPQITLADGLAEIMSDALGGGSRVSSGASWKHAEI